MEINISTCPINTTSACNEKGKGEMTNKLNKKGLKPEKVWGEGGQGYEHARMTVKQRNNKSDT